MNAPWPAAACRSCGALVIWTVTAAGKRMPADVLPKLDGTLALSGDAGQPPDSRVVARRERAAAGLLYVSHFATCPQAAQHRRPA